MIKIGAVLLCTLLFTLFTWAAPNCRSTHHRLDLLPTAFVFNDLMAKEKSVFAMQRDYDNEITYGSSGGACATVSAANLLQAIHARLSRQTPLDLQPILRKAFQDLPELRSGKVTNQNMTQLFGYFNQYIPGVTFKTQIDQATTMMLRPPAKKGVRNWLKMPTKVLLKPIAENENKILIFKVIGEYGTVVGRHFVVLREIKSPNEVVIQDPHDPSKNRSLEAVTLPSPITKLPTLQLVRPGTQKAGYYFYELDAIITVSLEPAP